MKTVYKIIWNISEYTGIGLGRYAPFVFERMTGIKGVNPSVEGKIYDELKPKYGSIRRKKIFMSYVHQILFNIGVFMIYMAFGVFLLFYISLG